MTHAAAVVMKNIERRHQMALDRLNDPADPGVARQKSRGKLTCRERITLLLDEGSFREIGSVAGFASLDASGALLDFTASSHVGGKGKIDGRPMVCCADDFTSRGGHSPPSTGVILGLVSAELLRFSTGASGPSSCNSRSILKVLRQMSQD